VARLGNVGLGLLPNILGMMENVEGIRGEVRNVDGTINNEWKVGKGCQGNNKDIMKRHWDAKGMFGGFQKDVGVFFCSFISVQVNSNIKPKKKKKKLG
jgi:hypothetical protein